MGKYAKADSLYQQALATFEKKLGSTHHKTITLRINMAEFYTALGNYAEGKRLLLDILNNKKFGSNRLNKASAQCHLGWLYYAKHHNDKAQRYIDNKEQELLEAINHYEEALNIYKRHLGSKKPDSIITAGDLALVYYEMGNYEKAERLFHETLDKCYQWLGSDAFETGISFQNLGMFYFLNGEFEQAEKFIKQALQIFQNQKKPYTEHPFIYGILKNLALIYFDKGQFEKAADYVHKAWHLERQELQQVLSFGSEAQWLAFQQQSYPYDLLTRLKDTTLLAEVVIQTKGIVLDGLLENQLIEKAKNTPNKKEKIAPVESTLWKLKGLQETMPKNFSQEQKTKLTLKREALENQLKRQLKAASAVLTPQE